MPKGYSNKTGLPTTEGKHWKIKDTSKMNQDKKGKKRPPFTEIWRKRIGEYWKGRKRPFIKKQQVSPLKGRKFPERSGENSPTWKGGITPERNKIRTSIEYNLWKNSVFARDNFTCQKTGVRGGNIVAHHIQNFAQYPELRFAIDNGITLSEKSHKEFHKIYRKQNNTREQLEEFLPVQKLQIEIE